MRHVVAVIFSFAFMDQARGILLAGPAGVRGVRGLVADAPKENRGVVPVAAYHFAHVVFLHLAVEINGLVVGNLLDGDDAVTVVEIVDHRHMRIVGRTHEIGVHAVADVQHVAFGEPLRHGVAQPRELLVTVGAVDMDFLSVDRERIVVVVPRKPTEAQRRMVGIQQPSCGVAYFAVDMVKVGGFGAP